MKIQIILSELKKEGWHFNEEFIRNNEDMLQAIADKTLALQLQQTGVSGSVSKYEKCNYAMPDCKHCALANCIYLNDGGM
jgi:hypothetical protein